MFEAVVMGVSLGGVDALGVLLPALPKNLRFSVSIVLHRQEGPGDFLAGPSAQPNTADDG